MKKLSICCIRNDGFYTFRIANIRFRNAFLQLKNAQVFLFSKRSANITKMHWHKIKHFLWKNAISYCVFPTEIHNFWNAFFAKQHSENNCAVLKEKIERFTYEQKFTIFRICCNDIKGFLYFNKQIKNKEMKKIYKKN